MEGSGLESTLQWLTILFCLSCKSTIMGFAILVASLFFLNFDLLNEHYCHLVIIMT